ncbi:hypothetical protein [Corallococcus exiguus]|uniref:hypothetical protein n=1 Tax=Corallococcus exiguus TaxID=83462 RepID=UPI0020B6BE9B|nr:hypothetical protein [Corallococcus exiguus]
MLTSKPRAAVRSRRNRVAQLRQQGLQLVEAAVDVSDDVEGAVLVLAVARQRAVLEGHRARRLRREHMHVPDAFLRQPLQRVLQLLHLIAQGSGTGVRPGPRAVSLQTERFRRVHGHRDQGHVILACQGHVVTT